MTNTQTNAGKLETLVNNAARLGHGAHTVALACGFLPGLEGVTSLCPWCVDAKGTAEVRCFALPRGGECCGCAYTGVDVCVVAPAVRS